MLQEYQIVDKTKAGLSTAVAKAKEVDAKYHVGARVTAGITKGMTGVANALSPRSKESVGGDSPNH